MQATQAFVALWMLAVVAAQRRYYNIHDMPVTKFDCRDKILGGYYADPEVNCQMFHVCVKIPGQGVQDFRFLCPNETVFDQEQQICADSGEIDCASSGLFFENFDLYRLGTAPAAKAQPVFGVSRNTPIPLGPSTRSPILTNSVVDDDDFYLQRSDTGDRRLHSKDLLRGSSSSNLFNTRNGGKDLDDDDDDAPRTANETPQSYRPKPSQQSRGKSQYNTQFRRTEGPTVTASVATTTTTTTTPIPPRAEEKKRTKVAVRKLSRKRITAADEKVTPATFTTQVTQRLSFGDTLDERYSTINRSPSSAAPQQPTRQYQNFRSRTEPSTPAAPPTNYQQQNNRGPTTPAVPVNYQQQNRGTTPSFQPNYQQNVNPSTPSHSSPSSTPFQQRPSAGPSTAFHSTFRPSEPSSTPAFFEPSGSPTPRPAAFNGRPIVASQTYQSPQPQAAPTTRAPNDFNRGHVQFNQQNNQFKPQNNQFNQQPQQNKQFNQQNNQFNHNNNQQNNQFNQQAQSNNQFNQQNQQNNQFNHNNNQQNSQNQFNRQPNYQRQSTPQTQTSQTPVQDFNKLTPQYKQNNQDFNRDHSQQRQPVARTNQPATQTPQPALNNQNNQFNQQHNNQFNQQFAQNNQQQFAQKSQNQFPQQSTRVTPVPSPQTRPPANLPVVRAQTINAALQPTPAPVNHRFNQNDDFEDDKQEFLKTAQSSNFRPSDINSFANSYKEGEKGTEVTKPPTTKYYTPTVVTTPKPVAPSTQPPKPAAPARPAATDSDKDKNDYDYAYYDDGNTFSEYDALDALNEQDFSRTNQRSKSRLI